MSYLVRGGGYFVIHHLHVLINIDISGQKNIIPIDHSKIASNQSFKQFCNHVFDIAVLNK